MWRIKLTLIFNHPSQFIREKKEPGVLKQLLSTKNIYII